MDEKSLSHYELGANPKYKYGRRVFWAKGYYLLADPEIFQQNRLPFHAHFADQTSPEMPLVVSLDGAWSFRYAENLTAPFSGSGTP